MAKKDSQIPMYSSIKYSNAFNLFSRTEKIKEAEEMGLFNMTQGELENLKTMQSSLKLKEQILGYLEDMTSGVSSSEELSPNQLREIQDFIFSDNPDIKLPEGANEKALEKIFWLRNYINTDDKNDNGKRKREVMRSLYIESRPELDLSKVENLVLAGGGAKALSLAGVVKSLDKQKMSPQIKRVAGTSGGAIIAMAYAAGYTPEEIEDVVKTNNFGLFSLNSSFDNKLMNQWALTFNSDKPRSKLHVLSDNKFAHAYNKSLMLEVPKLILNSDGPKSRVELAKKIRAQPGETIDVQFKNFLSTQENPDGIIRNLADRFTVDEGLLVTENAKRTTIESVGNEEYFAATSLYGSPSKAIVSALRHQMGHDLILEFFKDLVLDKLKKLDVRTLGLAIHGPEFGVSIHTVRKDEIRNMTFAQWQKLHELAPDKVKELHISLSIKKTSKLDRIKMHGYDAYDHADAAHDNPKLANMSVAEAVRVSMNLPPIFKSYKFEVDGVKYTGSDGGLKSNMSLNTFDKQDEYGKTNTHKTIGVFYKTGKELESAVDVNRMLILPRSKDEIAASIKELKVRIEPLNKKISELEGEFQILAKRSGKDSDYTKIAKLKLDDNVALMRRLSGELSAFENEENNLNQATNGKSLTHKVLNRSIGEIPKIVGRYFDAKSNDDLSGSANLRRLVMINTQDIDTIHFKMSQDDKRMQMSYGEKAMDSLLGGSYCLENHFYYHQVHVLERRFLSDAFKVGHDNILSNIFPKKQTPENEFQMNLDNKKSMMHDEVQGITIKHNLKR